MRIISETSAHEMARRFALGEVTSQFFVSNEAHYRGETLALLMSGDESRQLEGIGRHRKTRGDFIDSIPSDTRWNIARLELTAEEFRRLNTLRDNGWIDLTRGSLRLVTAAEQVERHPGCDPRLGAVVAACQRGSLKLSGITLLGQAEEGPLTIVEGTARLVALYLCCVLRTTSPHCAGEVEVVLGISPTKWCWS